MVRRRSLTLLLIFITTVLSIGLAVGNSWNGFLALNFLTGLFTVAPQVSHVQWLSPLMKKAYLLC